MRVDFDIYRVECHFTGVYVEGVGKTIPRCISASRLYIAKNNAHVFGIRLSMVPSVTLPDETGSQKVKMAAKIMQSHYLSSCK